LDEVSIGWNAYSILKTGRDEYKTMLPFVLRAYDDFRPALYVYLVIPFVALLGLTVMAVRLPSVTLSIFSFLFVYLLANTLLGKYVKKIFIGKITILPGHVAAFLLAISPWHIYISRLGHEVNAGLSFLIVGNTLFFLALSKQKKPWLFPLSALFFSLSFASYQSEKLIIPIFIFILGIVFLPFLKMQKSLVLAIIIGILVSLPTVLSTISATGMTRFSGTSAFTEGNPIYEQDRQLYMKAMVSQDIVGRLIHNPKITSIKVFASNYLSHFEPSWLFSGGPFSQHKVPYTGLLYWWELPFILLGIAILLLKRSRYGLILLTWILIAPLPAAITTQAPHALRSFTFLPGWQLVETIGILTVLSEFGTIKRAGIFLLLIVISSVLTFQMFQRYLTIFPETQSEAFAYALHDALSYVTHHYSVQTPILLDPYITVDHRMVGDTHMVAGDFETYMFYLFDMRYDPTIYQASGGTKSGSLGTEFSFGTVVVRNSKGKPLEKNQIYIGSEKDLPLGASTKYMGKFLDGASGVVVAEVMKIKETKNRIRVLRINNLILFILFFIKKYSPPKILIQ